MRANREIVVVVLLIGVLAAYLVLRKTDRRQYELPELAALEASEITRVVVRPGGPDAEVHLERDGQRWLIQPGGYPADASQVKGMLDVLAGLTITAVASEAGNDSVYDLDPARGILVEAFQGDRLLRAVRIGKAAPTGRHTFVKLQGDDERIFHALENLRGRFERDADGLRDRQVMKIEEEISELVLTEGGKRLGVVKTAFPPGDGAEEDGGPAAGAPEVSGWQTEGGRPVKAQEIDSLVRTVSALRCAGYPAESVRETLGPPVFSAVLKGAGEYEVSIYTKEEGNYLCTSSQSEFVFLLPEWQVKKIRLDLDGILESSPGETP